LKKRSKKLLRPRSGRRRAPNKQKFFGSFFQKRTAFFLHPIALGARPFVIAQEQRPLPLVGRARVGGRRSESKRIGITKKEAKRLNLASDVVLNPYAQMLSL
jgi:hypothetical protein